MAYLGLMHDSGLATAAYQQQRSSTVFNYASPQLQNRKTAAQWAAEYQQKVTKNAVAIIEENQKKYFKKNVDGDLIACIGGCSLEQGERYLTGQDKKEIKTNIVIGVITSIAPPLKAVKYAANAFELTKATSNLGKKKPLSEAIEKGIKENAKKATEQTKSVKKKSSKTGGFGKLFQQRAQTLREKSIEFNRVGRDLQVPGGLAGAIRHTKQTGNLVGGSDHLKKGRDAVKFYNRQIRQIRGSHSIPEAGRQRLIDIATRSRDKIQNALDGY